MTDREPLDTAVACYERLGISTLGVRERGMTTAGRVIYVVEVLRAEAILVAAKALDLQHPRKREKLEQMAAWVRQRQAAALPQPCSACRRKAKPLRRGLCNACRLRERRRSLRAVA